MSKDYQNCYLIILNLETKEEPENRLSKNNNLVNKDFALLNNSITLLPVNPLDILSVERVGYALQWWLNGQHYQSYPPSRFINLPDIVFENNSYLRKSHQNGYVDILRLPSPNELNALKQQLEKQRQEEILSQLSECIQPFEVCPVCQNQGSLTSLDCNNFQAECTQCHSSWGTKRCGNCGKNFSFLEVNNLENYLLSQQKSSLEESLGRDVLAIPYITEKKGLRFRCSFCGQ